MDRLHYYVASVVRASSAALPEGKSIARGWSAVYLGEGVDAMELEWPEVEGLLKKLDDQKSAGGAGPCDQSDQIVGTDHMIRMEQFNQHERLTYRLRLTAALDYRDAQLIEIYVRKSNRFIGSIDIRYAYMFQPFELKLDIFSAIAVLREGVRLEVRGGKEPLWVFDELDEKRELVNRQLGMSDGKREDDDDQLDFFNRST